MRIFIVAGEASGDLHASRLMQALRHALPSVEFFGIGGERMIAEGLHSLVSLEQMNVVGFWEVAKRYTFFKSVLQQAEQLMTEVGSDIFIPVDYPGFNMRLAAQAKKHAIPVAWYIAPQLWAWGKKRARNLARVVDKLLVVFPFETSFFQNFGIDTRFVGHPLLDDPAFAQFMPPREGREHAVAFLPGSRTQEVERHIPLFSEVAMELKKHFPLVRCIIASSRSVPEQVYKRAVGESQLFELNPDARAVMRQCAAGVVKTGTSTLEAALSGLPFTMIYKTSWLSYRIGRMLVELPHISLVNILAQKAVVRELVQHDANPTSIVTELRRLLSDDSYAEQMYREFADIRTLLGQSGASGRAAQEIIAMLKKS